MLLTSDPLDKLSQALALAQGELQDAAKGAVNPAFKSPDKPKGTSYADLSDVLQTIRPVASKHGLSFVQGVSYTDGLASVTTRLLHSSGQWLQEVLCVPVSKKDAQGLGSALTYGRRYSIAAMFGIAQDDDDANEAVKPKRTGTKEGTPAGRPAVSDAAEALRVAFDASTTSAEVRSLTADFVKLSPFEQDYVLPAAKAAKARVPKDS